MFYALVLWERSDISISIRISKPGVLLVIVAYVYAFVALMSSGDMVCISIKRKTFNQP